MFNMQKNEQSGKDSQRSVFNVPSGESKTGVGKGIIFRNDDVNYNTDWLELAKIYSSIREFFPEARILQAVTVFSHNKGIQKAGEVYQGEAPFKDNPLQWFYDVNQYLLDVPAFQGVETVSHGLFHTDHSVMSKDAQEMNIIGSCRMLGTKIFIPPFNRYNKDTEEVCCKNGIQLVKADDWKSLEYEIFNSNHRYWYFHSWRWTAKEFRKRAVRLPEIKEAKDALSASNV